MDHEVSWDSVGARLRRTRAVKVIKFEVGKPATDDDLEVIQLMRHALPPPPIAQFYSSNNGVKLLWNGKLAGQQAQGSINIVTLLKSTSRAPAQEDGAPLEGVLWNDEFAPRVLKDLKRMAIFEEIAGRSAYLTYSIDIDDARLFFVDNDRIKPIAPDFATTIELLKRYAGADGLREHLTYRNWQARVEADVVLQGIAAL